MIPGGVSLNKHIANLRTSGTIVPSSPFLVQRLIRGIDFARARTIVELGVGTGCVTRALLRRMRPDARLVSLELLAEFAEACDCVGDPRFTLHQACATTLPDVLAEEGIGSVDAVVSSLPLSIMDPAVVERILDAARDCLGPQGRFFQYQYSLSHHHRMLARYGGVDVGFTLLNVPPAFVYTCVQVPEGSRARHRRARRSFASLYAAALASVAMAVRALQEL